MTPQIAIPQIEMNTSIVDEIIAVDAQLSIMVKNTSAKNPNKIPTRIRKLSRILVDFFMSVFPPCLLCNIR